MVLGGEVFGDGDGRQGVAGQQSEAKASSVAHPGALQDCIRRLRRMAVTTRVLNITHQSSTSVSIKPSGELCAEATSNPLDGAVRVRESHLTVIMAVTSS